MCRHGENIYKRRDGRYEGRYVIGRNDQGRTKFGYVYGHSYNFVRRELMIRKANMETVSALAPKSGVTLQQWTDRYLLGERFSRLKPMSRQAYQSTYERHIAPYLGSMDLGQITAADIQRLSAILIRKKLAQSTVAGILRLLASMLRAAQEEGLIRRSPCSRIGLHHPPREEQRVLSVPEQERLRAAAVTNGSLATLLALYTGMRLGEICGLRWQDIDWLRGTLTVRHIAQRIQTEDPAQRTAVVISTPKSAKSRRVIPLPDFLLEQLKAAAADSQSEFVLGKADRPADPRNIQREFDRLIKPLNLPGTHFHTMRHTFATRLLELGVDVKTVSVLLGHSSARITLEFYAHSLIDQQRAAMERLAQAFF